MPLPVYIEINGHNFHTIKEPWQGKSAIFERLIRIFRIYEDEV